MSLLVLLIACKGSSPDDSAPPDSDSPSATAPCADGGWGRIGLVMDPADAVHVSPTLGDSEGDGSPEAPVDSIAAAQALARSTSGSRPIALWPGAYTAAVQVYANQADGLTDDGLVLAGCSPNEVSIAGAEADAPVIDVAIAKDIVLAGFTLSGGQRGLVVRSGSNADVQALTVDGALRQGVLVDGDATVLAATELQILDTEAEDGAYGWGLAVQKGTVTLSNGSIDNSVGMGIFAHEAAVDLQGVDVGGTRQDGDGLYGRGVHLQSLSTATIDGGTFAGNADASIFALQTVSTTIARIDIDTTVEGLTGDAGDATGDGVVFTQGASGTVYDPANFVLTLTDSSIRDSARAAMVLEGVTATLSGLTVTGSGLEVDGSSIFVQDGAKVSSADPVVELAADAMLGLNRIDLASDSVGP